MCRIKQRVDRSSGITPQSCTYTLYLACYPLNSIHCDIPLPTCPLCLTSDFLIMASLPIFFPVRSNAFILIIPSPTSNPDRSTLRSSVPLLPLASPLYRHSDSLAVDEAYQSLLSQSV